MRTKHNEQGSINTDDLPVFVNQSQILLYAYPAYNTAHQPITVTVWADGSKQNQALPIKDYMKNFFHQHGGDFFHIKSLQDHSYTPIPLDSCHQFISYIAFATEKKQSHRTCRHGYINYLAFAFSDFSPHPSLPNGTLIRIKDFHIVAHHKLERFLPRLRRGNDACFQLLLENLSSIALHLYCAKYLLTIAQREVISEQSKIIMDLVKDLL